MTMSLAPQTNASLTAFSCVVETSAAQYAVEQHSGRMGRPSRRHYSHSPYDFDVIGDSSTSSRLGSDVISDTASSNGREEGDAFALAPSAIDASQVLTPHHDPHMSFSATSEPLIPTPGASLTTAIHTRTSSANSVGEEAVLTAALHSGIDGLSMLTGRIAAVATTAKGSSYLQAMLDKHTQAALPLIYHEIAGELRHLLLHKYAAYVVKKLLLKLDRTSASEVVASLVRDDALLLRLCTADIHARRMFQFLITDVQGTKSALFDFILRHVRQVAFHEEGCVAIQRTLDVCPPAQREALYEAVRSALPAFCVDPHASFVVQYMLDNGAQRRNAEAFLGQFGGRFVLGLMSHPHAAKVTERLVARIPMVRVAVVNELLVSGAKELVQVLRHDGGCYALAAVARESNDREIELLYQHVVPVVMSTCTLSGRQQQTALPLAARRFADCVTRRLMANSERVALS